MFPLIGLRHYFRILLISTFLVLQLGRELRSEGTASPESGSQASSVVARIDTLLDGQWKSANLAPPQLVGNDEFIRRVYLDFLGVIPRVSRVRAFRSDNRPDKRQQLIEEVLASPRYATHMATVWRNRIIPGELDESRSREAAALHKWLQVRFAKNLRYDNLVGELLLTLGGDELGPGLYFRVNDLQPEKLATSASELFLGLNLQCAQCHDHPHEDWKQRDFWGFAAFFAQVQATGGREMAMDNTYRLVDNQTGDVRLPGTNEVVPPKFPGTKSTKENSDRSRRAALAIWMTSRENQYFAGAAVNWAWSHLFGEDLIQHTGATAADHNVRQQVLNELAQFFVASNYDLKQLWRAIAETHAYQSTSTSPGPADSTAGLVRVHAKPLTPEQLYDSYNLISPKGEVARPEQPMAVDFLEEDAQRRIFLRQMRSPPGDTTEYRASTLQALALMNGGIATGPTSHQSKLLGSLQAPFLTDYDRLDILFLATLSRSPTGPERDRSLAALGSSPPAEEREQFFSDVLWALLNSTEFAFNH
jgi:hypothetical protein